MLMDLRVLWNKLFSSKLFHKNFEIHFDENIHFCEDLLFAWYDNKKGTIEENIMMRN